ncbi:MAG TPA: DoxX-like family protein [Chthoniobacteraceae bacterium]|jgi:uncharacterized membrane protein YphA (DoxX/SURF4 family)|nr:DoxX-like family protein [Chthoniobacteraceae bacterium]
MKTSALHTVRLVKIASRVSLGLVWFYEGLIPKILYLGAYPEQTELVRRSGFYWSSPERTLIVLGIAQAVMGIVLILGLAERAAVALATLGMGVLIVLVATGRPLMLTDPFGALAKDTCLIACALTVWLLAPIVAGLPTQRRERPSSLQHDSKTRQ